MKWWGVVFFLLACFATKKSGAQNISNEGTDFWTVFPTHDPSLSRAGVPQLANIRIYITAKSNSKAFVQCGSYSEVKSIPANQATWFDVPRAQAYINFNEQNTKLIGRGIHIQVPEGEPKVAVYAHIYAGARSAASLILPQESLGQKYFSMNYTQSFDTTKTNRNFLTVIATEPNTDVIIHPATRSPIRISLANAGDVYEYLPEGDQDLTGTYVEVDPTSPDNCTKRFAVFSGSTSLTIGNCIDSRDPLYQQLYPTSSWGKSYAVVPFLSRYFYLRVIAEEDDTEVRINNVRVATLNKGGVFRSDAGPPSLGAQLITASKKISVAQYALTQSCGSPQGGLFGDPEMVLLNPLEFNIKNVTLFSSDKEAIVQRYINVCIKTTARKTFKIDGRTLSDDLWQTMPSSPDLSYIQVPIENVSSTLTANEGFNAIAYGFGDHESYAYSAGTNLAANNYLLVSNSVTGFDAPNACLDQRSNFKIILNFPAQENKITWQLDNEPPVVLTTAPRIFPAANGDQLYEYEYNINRVFTEIKAHTMQVTATMPTIGTCIGRLIEYSFDFNAYPIPKAKIGAAEEVCFDAPAVFTDLSESNVSSKPVNKWLWDFGDGETSTEQNPTHIYKSSGDFEVKFSAGLEEACMSDPVMKKITVRPKISPGFQFNAIACLNSEVEFKDQSTVENNKAKVNSWIWDFGDGSPVDRRQNPTHTYKNPGPYPVKLTVGTDNGCESSVTLSILVKGLPIVNFKVPEICSEDAAAQFDNLSTDTDGNMNGLSYQWNFGDPDSQSENISNVQTGKHKYVRPGPYNVTLTVITSDGCINTKTQQLFVNGSVIKPEFIVTGDKDNLCSSDKVVVKNNSTVNEGGFSKIIWVLDADKPTERIIDEDPELGEIYSFTYPAATSATPRHITITMYAYSGITCVQPYPQDITIYPSPNLVFDPIPPLCLNAGKIVLTQARETLGVAGRGEYSGPGLSADGTFDPILAGVGTHTLKYVFESDNRCKSEIIRTITVFPVPIVNVLKDFFIYAGEQKAIGLSATGSGLTYKWEPSIDLDRDDVANPVVTGDTERTYAVTVRSSDGCEIVEKINIHIIPDIEGPNSFSPNGDGINDTWVIRNIEIYLNATVEVFNRYGTRVYLSKGFYKPFDGNYKDLPLPVGTYYYIINPNNGRKILTGPLTLIR